MNKREAEILRLRQEQIADISLLTRLMELRRNKTGRPSEPMRDLLIYRLVSAARTLERPKHPGLEPVLLSWDKAYEVVKWRLSTKTEDVELRFPDGTLKKGTFCADEEVALLGLANESIDTGGIRHAVARGKKIHGLIERILDRSDRIRALEKKPAKRSRKKVR